MSDFIIVPKISIPAVWQVDPQGIVSMLQNKSKAGLTVAAEGLAKSRARALAKKAAVLPAEWE